MQTLRALDGAISYFPVTLLNGSCDVVPNGLALGISYIPAPSLASLRPSVVRKLYSTVVGKVSYILQWLYERGYEYRDLAARNVLVDPCSHDVWLVDTETVVPRGSGGKMEKADSEAWALLQAKWLWEEEVQWRLTE